VSGGHLPVGPSPHWIPPGCPPPGDGALRPGFAEILRAGGADVADASEDSAAVGILTHAFFDASHGGATPPPSQTPAVPSTPRTWMRF